MKFKLFALAFVATVQLATAVRLNSVHRHLRTGHKGHKCLHGVKGICGLPSACTGGKLKRGHCKGDSSNVCCVKRSKHGHRGHKCLHGVEGICGLPSACTGGELKSGHCKGGSDNICCVSNSEEEPSKSSSWLGETFDFAKRDLKEKKAYNSLTPNANYEIRTTRPPEKNEEKGWWDSFKDTVADGTKQLVDGTKHYGGKIVDGTKHYGGKFVDGAKHYGGILWDKTKHHGGRLLNGAQKTAEEYVVKPTQHLGEKVGINLYGSRDERGNPEYESGRIYFKKREEFPRDCKLQKRF